jgi:hypothetical protein
VADRGWKRPFDDSISLPRGRQLVTLRDAAEYIQKLPEAEQLLEEWQAAVEALLLVVELNGPTMMARIGVMRALNRDVERRFDSSRKEKHWAGGSLRGTNENSHGWSRGGSLVEL